MLVTIGFFHLMFATSFMVVNSGKDDACDWTAEVWTGGEKRADTDDGVYIMIFGKQGSTSYTKLDSPKDDFRRGGKDVFHFKSKCRIPYEIKMKIGGRDGWYLETVELVRKDIGDKYLFACHCWLDDYAVKGIGIQSQGIKPTCDWTAMVWTGTEPFGDTDNGIRMQIYENKISTEYHSLSSNNDDFEKGNSDVYTFKSKCLTPTKIRMKIGGSDGWFLYKVELQRKDVSTNYVFLCHCWLDNGETVFVNLTPPGSPDHCDWLAVVFTSYKDRADTDDGVKINIYGDSTESTATQRLTSNKDDFEKGATDLFWFQSKCIEPKRIKLKISGEDGWNVAKVELYQTGRNGTHKYDFVCQCWIDDAGSKFVDVSESVLVNKRLEPL